MNDGITLCVVGAGSSYTPELLEGLLAHTPEQLPVSDLRLCDPDPDRLAIMAGLAERMITQAGRRITVRQGANLATLLAGVDFVVTQVRVGGMAARALDERLPLRYGLLGQETTGPGGMFKALRTIPPLLEIARTVERIAPQAFILNYTNPSGIIAEAISRYTGARIVGLCSGLPRLQESVADALRDDFGEVRSYCVGLNHLGFLCKFMAADEDLTAQALPVLEARAAAAEDHAGLAAPEVIRYLGAVPLGYLDHYLKRRETVEHALTSERTRAEEIMEIERDVLEAAADPATVTKPEALSRRGGGGYAGVTFRFLRALAFDLGEELICTVPNQGAVEGIEPEAGVEIVCTVGRSGPQPVPFGPLPLAFRGLVQAVKAYETLTVEAAVRRDRTLAIQALLNHPLVGDLPTAEALVDEMLAAHGLSFT